MDKDKHPSNNFPQCDGCRLFHPSDGCEAINILRDTNQRYLNGKIFDHQYAEIITLQKFRINTVGCRHQETFDNEVIENVT